MPVTHVVGPWNDPVGHGGKNQHMHLETHTSAECVVVGNWILRQDKSARVSEHPAFGGVHPVHNGRAHYEHRALDINLSYGSPPPERPFLDRLRADLPVGLDVRKLASQIKRLTTTGDWMANEAAKINDLHQALPQIRELANFMPILQRDMAERIAKVVKYLKANEANDKARAAEILKELDDLSKWDVGSG